MFRPGPFRGTNNNFASTIDIWGLLKYTGVDAYPHMAVDPRRQVPAVIVESRAQGGED